MCPARWHWETRRGNICRYARKYEDGAKEINDSLAQLKEHAAAIRVLVHTQPRKVNIGFQKAHMMEIQVNGGSIADKVDFAYGLFEKEVCCHSFDGSMSVLYITEELLPTP